ncbi:MAG: hypothetical protein E7773_11950 [Sphingomonas sp.]|uniref:hypothetical protein n=1 Tax=Sphingomonas sp. TaxID=28214 RepID=UPI0012023BE2|nr:hypothetical protein [Sphingomonas sp.]THD35159.1 MAG: hypothetical protein E7773_11950 [Sphingomonas sp.]
MIRTAFAALTLLALPVGAIAQDKQGETGQPPKRIKSVTISATEKCPPSTGDEIVVCTTVDNPYRIPKELRDSGPIPAKNQAWTNRVAADEQTSRVAAGLPDTCSPVGTGGQTGCARALAQQFKAEKRARANGQDPNAPPDGQ